MLVIVLATVSQALAAPSYCVISGTVLKGNGSPCANCNITFRVPYAQRIGGTTIEAGIVQNFTLSASGVVPASKQLAQTLVAEITIDKGPAVQLQIPASATADLSSLITPPINLPTGSDINGLTGYPLGITGGGTNATSFTAGRCIQASADGLSLESAAAACGSGGGSSNSFETWATSSGTSPVADSATDTMTFTATAPLVATGSSAADSITLSCTAASSGVTGCLSGTDWTTFNGKVATTRTINTTAPITGGGDLSADRTLDCTAASTSVKGCLTSTDWNTFNGKQASDADLTAIAALSGTGYAVRTGSNTWALQTISGGYGVDVNLVGADTGISFNPVSTTGDITWSGGGTASLAWTWNLSGTDVVATFTSGNTSFSGTLQQAGVNVVTTTGSQTLTNKTLTTPTIGDFTNATHNHSNNAGGGTIAHSALTGLTTGDPHTQYVLIAGRTGSTNNFAVSSSAGGTISGSTQTANDLTLRPNNADTTTGAINLNAPSTVLYTSYPASTSASNDLLSFTSTSTLSGTPILNGYNFSPALTLSSATDGVNALKVGGSWSVSSTSPLVRGLLFAPTIDYSNTTDPFPVYQVNAATCAPTFTSSTANGTLYQDCFVDGTTITYSGAADLDNNASTGNLWAPISVLINGTTQTSGVGDLTIGKIVGMQYQGVFDTGNAASVLTVSDLDLVRSAVPSCTSANCGPGSVAITSFSLANGNFTTALDTALTIGTAYGMRLQSWDKATTNITLFSDATGATMRHAGAARFGATGAPSAGYSVDSAGAVQIGTAGGVIADVSSGTTAFIGATDSVDMTGGVLAGFDFEPTSTLSGGAATPSIAAIRFVPTVSESALIPNIFGLTMGGTSTSTAGTLQTSIAVSNTMTYTSATANVNPINSLTGLTNNATVSQTAASGSVTVGSYIGLQHAPILTENSSGGATGSMTLTSDTAVNVAGTYTQTAGTLAVTTRTGLKFNAPTDASNVLVNNLAVDCAATTKGSTERSCIRSALAANAAAFFLHDTGGAQMSTVGKFTTYNNVATAGMGLGTVVNETISGSNSSTDYTSNSYTPAAAAARYRVTMVLNVASTTAGTLRCTVDYHDSAGNTQTAIPLPFSAAGVYNTTPGTGVVVTALKEHVCGPIEITVDNSASAITPKVVHTNTVVYTVATAIERLG